ncbi:MAG: carbamoyltransferase HypF [Fuerstia sp.]|nr:carbamoyltransferase HypF [Fuerstiella sp.]
MNSLGVLLPTTPLHALLLNELKTPLVVTSGNQDSEPLAFDEREARRSLREVADGWLHHDRPIERPIDDSVVRLIAGQAVTMRAARGMAPMRLPLKTHHSILAVGGEQKVACALSNGRQAVLGPHIGDMSSLAVRRRFVEHTTSLEQLYGAEPTVIAHDLHPDYFTTRWAADQGLRTVGVQHHHAHVVSGMLQHGLLDQQVLGVAFDGTGYGPDGTIWGGEFLLTTKTEFRRVASLMPFVLPGGEASIREPWRAAVSLLSAAIPEITAEQMAELLTRNGLPTLFQIRQVQQLVRSRLSPLTSSMGRLFDGVASMVLGVGTAGFEGEPAMRLEAACDETDADRSWPLADRTFEPTEAEQRVDWRPIVRQVVRELQSGQSASVIAMRFHRAIANAVGMVAERFPGYPVVLSGGCFQNRILTELVVDELRQQSRTVASPGTIPPNDGGLAAGQIAIAAAILEAEEQQEKSRCV